jgi:CBS domain-containing membrane protein
MARDVVHAPATLPLPEVRALMAKRGLWSLPVVDDAGRVQGIVGALDLTAEGRNAGEVARRPLLVQEDTPVARLIGPLGSGAHRAAIVIDDARRLRGLVTQTDLLAALALRPSVAPAAAGPAPASR